MNTLDMKKTICGGNSMDGELTWLKSWGATADNKQDAWKEVLIAKGYDSISDDVPTMKKTWLRSQTGNYSDNLMDLENYSLINGLYTFAPAVALYDNNRGITQTGSGISTWTDQISSYDNDQSTDSERPTYVDNLPTFDNSANQSLVGGSNRNDLAFEADDFSVVTLFKTSADYSVDGTGMLFSTGAILGNLKGFGMYFSSLDNKLKFRIRYGTSSSLIDIVSNDALRDGNWHVAYFQRESGTSKMWVDNVEQTSNSSTVADMGAVGTSPFTISNETGSFNGYFDGELPQIQVFSEVLKTNEITNISNNLIAKVS